MPAEDQAVLRRHRVSVGRIGKLECDFICCERDGCSYVQMAMTIADLK